MKNDWVEARRGRRQETAAGGAAFAGHWALQALEARLLLSLDPTGLEQEMLEAVNRMRLNPAAELAILVDSIDPIHSTDVDVNNALQFFNVDGPTLQSQWDELVAAPPLAWQEDLYDAARAHSQLMIDFDEQSHQLSGELGLLARIQAQGYPQPQIVRENVYAYADSVFAGHAGFAIDWGNEVNGIQDPPGHRITIMSSDVREIGIGILAENNSGTTVGPLVVTQDFGNRFSFGNPYLLGVIYDDGNSNESYNAGEGLSGIEIDINGPAGHFTTTSMTAGGYQLQVPVGVYTVTFSGTGINTEIVVDNVVVAANNVKLDAQTVDPADASIAGTAFLDENRNSSMDEGETGREGATFFLDTDNDGQLDVGETSVTSDSDGQYSFTNLARGTYRVRENLVDGLTWTSPDSGLRSVIVTTSEQVADQNFGAAESADASIAGMAFLDADRDGLLDEGELPRVAATFYLDANNNSQLDGDEVSTVSDASGQYSFSNLFSGTYRVRESLGADLTWTNPSDGVHVVELAASEQVTDQDFAARLVVPTDLFASALTAMLGRLTPEVVVPGDRLSLSLTLGNGGSATASGRVTNAFFLSADETLDDDDVLLGRFANQTISLRTGQSRIFRYTAVVPAGVADGDYFLLGVADETGVIADNDTTNNVAASGDFAVAKQFGALPGRNNVRLNTSGDGGATAMFSVTGGATGQLVEDDDGQLDLIITGATASSSLTVTARGAFTLDDITIDGPLRGFMARGVAVSGDLSSAGTISSLTLGNVTAGSSFVISGDLGKITLGQLADFNLQVDGAVSSFSGVNWLNGSLTANSLRMLTLAGDRRAAISGDLTADITLSDSAATLLKFSAAGSITDSVIRTAGSIGTFSAGVLSDSSVLAGVGGAVAGLPSEIGDFLEPRTSIRSISLTNRTAAEGNFLRSIIAAWSIGSASLKEVALVEEGETFGLAASAVTSLSYTAQGQNVRLSRLSSASIINPAVLPGLFRVNLV